MYSRLSNHFWLFNSKLHHLWLEMQVDTNLRVLFTRLRFRNQWKQYSNKTVDNTWHTAAISPYRKIFFVSQGPSLAMTVMIVHVMTWLNYKRKMFTIGLNSNASTSIYTHSCGAATYGIVHTREPHLCVVDATFP